ncbi:ATP-binding protein [uncultured Variovorax sp.]|uniref:sensor histidine kinase n=1 Tax=uncultured Variovorax sp. TaxID=114708 RepID=UPI0025FBE1E0|nr:ATP-binding protein [uncultured Variovorax sp.]
MPGLRLLALLVLLWLGIGWSFSAKALTLVEQARLTLTLHGKQPAEQPPQPHAVQLPYNWDQRQGAVDGEAAFAFDIPVADAKVPQALFVPRLGNSFRVLVDGRELARFGTFPPGPYDDASFTPQYFALPDSSASVRRVEIVVAAQAARQGGLSPVVAGTAAEIRPLYEDALFWQISGGRFIAIVSGVLGALSLLVWLRQRESLYLYYGLGELLWSVQTARVLFTHAPLPWPWWGVVPLAAFQAAVPLLCRFALSVVGKGDTRLARFLGLLALLAPVTATLGITVPLLWLMPAWQVLFFLAGLAMVVVVLRVAVRSPVLEHRVLGVAVVLVVLSAARDTWVMRTSPEAYAVVPWIRFAWVGFAISLAWVIAERMRKDVRAMAQMNASLEAELAERNAALEAVFAREREAEKARGALEERQRLTQDLHDGLGGQLVGLLQMAQQPGTAMNDVALHLRDAVDQLKLTVDAMHGCEGDVASALGSVRYRLGPRLQSAGIDLRWDVGSLPTMTSWTARESHQLQMLLFEAFGNLVAHAQATQASLGARLVEGEQQGDEQGAIEIELRDNGRGFDAQAAFAGKGLANMRARAAALGGAFTVRSRPGETCLLLRLPVPASPSTARGEPLPSMGQPANATLR